jgi:dienelactone hydrolase
MTAPIFFALVALGVIETGEAAFRPTPDEPGVPERFRMQAATFRFEFEPRLDARGYSVSAVRFPSAVVSPDPENNTVHAEYFLPREARESDHRPSVIVLHILGADFALSRYVAARLADRGVAALFVKLPYYGERRPAGEAGGKKKFLSEDVGRSIESMRQGVLDVRRAAAWLGSRPELDPGKIGVTGISLGGIVASLAAAIDPAIGRAALLMAGGDLAQILWEMPEGAKYRALWVESGRTIDDLRALTEPFDPLTYAHRLAGKDVMMIAGKTDEVIPPASSRKLWEAAGRPPITWYDCGHYSAIGYLMPAIRRTVDFFAAPQEK